MTRVGVAIISWPSFEEQATQILSEVRHRADVVRVLHNSDKPQSESWEDGEEWITLPAEAFFASKFKWTIDNLDVDVLLFIVADTTFYDWGELVERCRHTFGSDQGIGVWAPVVDETWWNMEKILIEGGSRTDGLRDVVAVDSIVWALSSDVVAPLRSLDYSRSRFGWGIEVTSAAMARAQGKSVVCDPGLMVSHRRGTTYSTERAVVEAEVFYQQLSPPLRAMTALVEEFALAKTVSTPVTLWHRVRRAWGYVRDFVFRHTLKQWRGRF